MFANVSPLFYLLPVFYVLVTAFIIFALVLFVRFLLVATRAAKLYIREHDTLPPVPPVPPAS
jgi:hypothetical protein